MGIIQAFQGKTNLSVGTVAAGKNQTKFVLFFVMSLFKVGKTFSFALKCVWQL
jgi:hypothetical protein